MILVALIFAAIELELLKKILNTLDNMKTLAVPTLITYIEPHTFSNLPSRQCPVLLRFQQSRELFITMQNYVGYFVINIKVIGQSFQILFHFKHIVLLTLFPSIFKHVPPEQLNSLMVKSSAISFFSISTRHGTQNSLSELTLVSSFSDSLNAFTIYDDILTCASALSAA